jgi:hypothetical protein
MGKDSKKLLMPPQGVASSAQGLALEHLTFFYVSSVYRLRSAFSDRQPMKRLKMNKCKYLPSLDMRIQGLLLLLTQAELTACWSIYAGLIFQSRIRFRGEKSCG